MKTGMTLGKKILLGSGIVVGIILCVLIAYVLYILLSYRRIADHMVVEPESGTDLGSLVAVGETYSITTYNIGFGAYTPQFSFFMDGGKSSVAESPESVREMVEGAAGYVDDNVAPDFMLWQEVDIDSTRSHHINLLDMLKQYFPEYDSVFALNYDSAFLFYPFTEPHGKSKAGLATLSSFRVESAERRSFPITDSLNKFFDLDRCYTVSRIPVENGKYLCIYNLHMSAYGSDDSVRAGQISMICEDMAAEYAKGNYVICGGDFNHNLKMLDETEKPELSWAYPFPRTSLPEGLRFCIDDFSEEERTAMWDSARNADMPYIEGVTFTITLDGFLISDNVECVSYENLNNGYAYSDHDPVYMQFKLK